jgi:cyclopropane fatty-acyl-phospholipid synthase-like methyltransferase
VEETYTAAWEAEYASGRYLDEPPVAFVDDIVRASAATSRTRGLYIGCGNGRNFMPLLEAGMDLVGLDISFTALQQLRTRLAPRRGSLICGEVRSLDPSALFDVIVAIQVFQHGTRAETHRHIRDAQRHVAPGGLMCVRVNSTATDVFPAHDVVEREGDRSFTVQYREGAKKGLDVHFFSEPELRTLFAEAFTPVLDPREQVTTRTPASLGQWTQWEGMWRRTR